MRQATKNNMRLVIILLMIVCNTTIISGGHLSNIKQDLSISDSVTIYNKSDRVIETVPVYTAQASIASIASLEMMRSEIVKANEYGDSIQEYIEAYPEIKAEEERRRLEFEERIRQEEERKRLEEERRKEEERIRKRTDYLHSIKVPSNVNTSSGVTLEHMRYILNQTGLRGTEHAFYKVDKSGINFFYAVAVSINESGWKSNSSRARARNDVFGITSVNRYYESKQECIYYFGDFQHRLYMSKGLTTVEKIAGKYCPSNPQKWRNDVTSIMKDLYNIALSIPQ